MAFLPLGIWVWLQAQRIDALTRRVAELEMQLFSARHITKPAEAPSPAPAPQQEELLLTEVVPTDVLILDTPIPDASNDLEETLAAPPPAPPAADRPRMHSPLLLTEVTPPAPTQSEPAAPKRRLDQWLAESGLAWASGIILAMAAIWGVSEATKSAWFTPPVRLSLALVLGAIMLSASQWTRRDGINRPPGHPLISALLAGAAIVVLYATTWAAHGIYHFVDWPTAVAFLTLSTLALIGLSFLHGQALGVLAIALALLAPALASANLWPSWALTIYVALVSGGGFSLAILRRWSWVALVTIGGLYFWFFAAIATDDVRRALALISLASLGGLLTAFRAAAADEAKANLTWSAVRDVGPSIAVSVSSALLIWAWLVVAPTPAGALAGPALISIFHVALASYGVRERKIAPAGLVIAIGAVVIGFMAYLRARFFYGDLGLGFYPTVLVAAFSIFLCALYANPHRTGRALIAAAGAAGVALLTVIVATSRTDWHSPAAWAPLFAGAVLTYVAAWYAERTAQDRKTNTGVTWWAGASAALVLLGVESAFGPEFRTLGHAAAALFFSIGFVWRGWRVAGWATLSAGALSIAQALSPALIGPTLDGTFPIWGGLLIFATVAVFLFSASTIIRRGATNISIAEGLSAASVIVVLAGVFVALSWIAEGKIGVALDDFTEASLRVLALMAAGLTLLPRVHETPGLIGAWRGHVLLALGITYALVVAGLGLNPWWGGPGHGVINGAPTFNTLAVAFAAPAALAFAAANRLYIRQRTFGRIYAVAGGVLALIWLIMEVRHAFHDAEMASPETGLFESACYAIAFLAFALMVAVVARMRARRTLIRPFTEDLMHSMRSVSWAAIGASAFILLAAQHPIWGAQDSDASNAFSTMLAVLAQAVAGLLALALGRALSVSEQTDTARFAAACAAVLFTWSFGHCAIGWLHHRGYMDNGDAPYALEGIAHALWPLILVIAAAQLTRMAPGRETTRQYLFDLQAIWSAAIWPALAFAGLGLWVLYNPWWGVLPAQLSTPFGAVIAIAAYLGAATLSYVAPDVPHVRGMKWMVPAATIAYAAHIFVAVTLIVRWLYHRDSIATASAGEFELWAYSGVWAILAAASLIAGTRINDPVLRWIGLALFAVTIVKVLALDTARLSTLVRIGSFLGLGATAAVATWLVRRSRPAPGPGDLVTVTPSARRERRRVRRRTSQ
ncbi:hypothetical protein ATE48_11780 [Candidatus Viadribacter manganicus]|uniref:DUF2339 domain-containing protein n=1 Tax=Candidatus Viadribacter manganicus TaxID=1759059 RepID=A0A1B1AJ08_9PROT|nr:hypothetical protein ATE48_11780 [Candidatus Viadribacter manganicus]